ncbi:S9 family peptidase [bacterium]|nr:S9 family peptidase [bacterium]
MCLTAGFSTATASSNQALPPLIPREVLFGNPEKSNPQISPNGKCIAYLAPVGAKKVLNVWVKTVGQNDDHSVSGDTNRGVRLYTWAHNNKYILYIQDEGGNEDWHLHRVDIETKETVDLTPFEGVAVGALATKEKFPNDVLVMMNKENPQVFDVYYLNILTGVLELRAKNPGNVSGWFADSDLKVRAAKTFNDDGGESLLFRKTESDPWETIENYGFEEVEHLAVCGFTNDGKKLCVKDALGSDTSRIVEYDCESWKRTILAQDQTFDAHRLFLGKKPLAANFQKERCEWSAIDDEFAPALRAMQAIDDGDLNIINSSADERFFVIEFVHDDRSERFYLFDAKTNKADFLFSSDPELDKYQFASMEPISFVSRDGLKISGYLTCPVGVPRKSLPLVLSVHGGPWGTRDVWKFSPMAQWCANCGYACLQLNFRGSSGYGKSFLNAGNHEWAAKMHDDLIDGVNWAVDHGIADPNKVTIFGGSYGGYAALVGATFTPDVFCCAVDYVGPSNLVTLLRSMPPYWLCWKKQYEMRLGDPEKDVEFLKERSPLFKVDNIKIPILIAQGANDPRVKQAESEQIVEAMKAKNLPYEYVLFPDEGHGFAKPENRLKFFAIAERFLAKSLGGRHQD